MIKRSTIAMAVAQACMCSFVLAQTTMAQAAEQSATLYGKIDAFAEYDSGGSQGSRLAFDSGGLAGTRWGVKGGMNLDSVAPDLKAIYQLEGGIFANNGRQAQGGRLFGRQIYAGVTGGFGTVTFGRQYTPLLITIATFDSFGQGYASPTNDGQVSFGLDSRYDNALIYSTPNLGGFNASAMVALGGKTGGTSNNGAAGLNIGYATGPLELGLAFQRDDHYLATASTVQNVFGGAAYKFGKIKLMGGYGTVRTELDAGGELRRKEWLLGSQIDVTDSGQLWLNYGTGKTEDANPSDKSSAASVAWVQSFTKQARVYFVGSVHNNDAGSALVPVGTSSSGAYTISPGDTARALAVGFQYDF